MTERRSVSSNSASRSVGAAPHLSYRHRIISRGVSLRAATTFILGPEPIKDWSLTTLKDKLIKIGAKVVSHGRYIVFQMAEVAIPRQMIQEILQLIANCGCCRRRHRHETSDLHASTTTNGRNASESPRKMARQTLERDAGACCAGSRPYLGSGLLGSPENRYNLPHFRVHRGNPG